MTNNQRWIILDIVLIFIFVFAISGKSKSTSFEIERVDYEALLSRAKKWEAVRTNQPIINQTNDIIYINISDLLKYEIKVQRADTLYPVIEINGGIGVKSSYPFLTAPIEIGLGLRPNLFIYTRSDAVGFFISNFNIEVGMKLVYP